VDLVASIWFSAMNFSFTHSHDIKSPIDLRIKMAAGPMMHAMLCVSYLEVHGGHMYQYGDLYVHGRPMYQSGIRSNPRSSHTISTCSTCSTTK
jgi:hypothetical protein